MKRRLIKCYTPGGYRAYVVLVDGVCLGRIMFNRTDGWIGVDLAGAYHWGGPKERGLTRDDAIQTLLAAAEMKS